MSNIIIGNGLNIQFSGCAYTSNSIISRALMNVQKGEIPQEVYPTDIGDWLKLLYEEYSNVISGADDGYVRTSDERKALRDFKRRYSNWSIKHITDIGFEDYFLIHDIFCYKNNIQNPKMWDLREFLKRLFLDSIFDEGRILELYKKFPAKLIRFYNSFDNIFTTNYDNNVEVSLNGKKAVHYLHGAFHILDELYDPDSFRNQLPDIEFDKLRVNDKYLHVYSNALSYATGDDKDFSMTAHGKTNSVVDKFAEVYDKDPKIRQDIDSWSNSDNKTKNLYTAIMKKRKNSDLEFKEYYPVNEFKNISGSLTIFGLSPFNDNHLFNYINENETLDSVIFYYFCDSEISSTKKLLPNKSISFQSTKEFWNAI